MVNRILKFKVTSRWSILLFNVRVQEKAKVGMIGFGGVKLVMYQSMEGQLVYKRFKESVKALKNEEAAGQMKLYVR